MNVIFSKADHSFIMFRRFIRLHFIFCFLLLRSLFLLEFFLSRYNKGICTLSLRWYSSSLAFISIRLLYSLHVFVPKFLFITHSSIFPTIFFTFSLPNHCSIPFLSFQLFPFQKWAVQTLTAVRCFSLWICAILSSSSRSSTLCKFPWSPFWCGLRNPLSLVWKTSWAKSKRRFPGRFLSWKNLIFWPPIVWRSASLKKS